MVTSRKTGYWATLSNGRSLARDMKSREDTPRPYIGAHCKTHGRRCDGQLVVIKDHGMVTVACECPCHGGQS